MTSIERVDAIGLAADLRFWRLYDETFPVAERDPVPVVLATSELPVGFVLRAQNSKETVGFAVAHQLRAVSVTFLVYLAVEPTSRRQHIGTALLSAIESLGQYNFEAGGTRSRGVVWEIDDPYQDVSGTERVVRSARREFFERSGATMLDVPYVQPPLNGCAPVPMRLMFREDPQATSQGPPDVDLIVRAIYAEKYQALNGIPQTVTDRLRISARS